MNTRVSRTADLLLNLTGSDFYPISSSLISPRGSGSVLVFSTADILTRSSRKKMQVKLITIV